MLSEFIATILCYLKWMISAIPWAIISAFNLVLSTLAAAVNAAISLLPSVNPEVPRIGSDIIGMLNWMFPVGPLVIEAGLIVTAWAMYLAYRYLFRWVI